MESPRKGFGCIHPQNVEQCRQQVELRAGCVRAAACPAGVAGYIEGPENVVELRQPGVGAAAPDKTAHERVVGRQEHQRVGGARRAFEASQKTPKAASSECTASSRALPWVPG